MQVVQTEDHVLTYDWEDVESVQFSTPRDVIKISETERQFGKCHLNLTVNFKDGKGPLWVKKGE